MNEGPRRSGKTVHIFFVLTWISLALFCARPVLAEEPPPVDGKFAAELEFRSPLLHRLYWAGGAAATIMSGFVSPLLIPVAGAGVFLGYPFGVTLMHAMHLPWLKLRHAELAERGKRDYKVSGAVNHFKMDYPDGMQFESFFDYTVVETIMLPQTIPEWKTNRDRLQRDVYGTAAEVGLRPNTFGNLFGGATHINIDVASNIGGDARLFRNFLVDFANHSELATGVLDKDYVNAPPLNRDPAKRKRFAEAIARFDRGEITTIEELALEVHKAVSGKTGELLMGSQGKRDALSLKSFLEPNKARHRIEIRSMRGVADADELIRYFELFQARIRYLKKYPGLVRYIDRGPILDPKESVEHYYQYVVESGLRWEDYFEGLPFAYRGYFVDENGTALGGPKGFGACLIKLGQLMPF